MQTLKKTDFEENGCGYIREHQSKTNHPAPFNEHDRNNHPPCFRLTEDVSVLGMLRVSEARFHEIRPVVFKEFESV